MPGLSLIHILTVSMPSGYFGTVVISSSDEGVLSNGGDGVANIGAVSYTHLDVYKRQPIL